MPIRITTMKNPDTIKRWWGCGPTGVKIGLATLEKSLAISTNTNHMLILWPSTSTPGDVPNEDKGICPPKDLCKMIHSSFIHDSSQMEATQAPIKTEWLYNTQWNTMEWWKRMDSIYTEDHGWISHTQCQTKKATQKHILHCFIRSVKTVN